MLPISTESEIFSENSIEAANHDEHWQEDDMDENMEQSEEENESAARDFSQNQVVLTFSWTLMNQLKYLSRTEGICVEDLLIELVAEGVTKRAFEDQNKSIPSHLMTRNGYVHNSQDGNSTFTQPQMSHHSMNNSRPQNGQNNRKAGPQRNNQYNNNNNRYPANNRNYQNNNRGNSPQGQNSPFKNNGKSYHQQQNGTSPQRNGNGPQIQSNQRFQNESIPLETKKKYTP